MGEKTASQVQDVVVAGSQSSNFLLPKENKSWSIGVPWLTMASLMLRLRPTKQSLQRLLPFFLLVCRDRGLAGGRGRLFHAHTQTRGQVLLYVWPLGPCCSCWGWNNSKSILSPNPSNPPPRSASIRLYYCISSNSSQNKPCPTVMIVLISAV